MIQPMKLIGAVCLVLSMTPAIAQKAEILLVSNDGSRSACDDVMDAGTIASITPLRAQSNLAGQQPIVLCHGDQIFINHNGDHDFAGDPDPLTASGIGYAFYSCVPSVSGPELDNITAMDCPIVNPPPPNNGLWFARGSHEGDVVFLNDGSIQQQFFGGRADTMWFAPITVTRFDDDFGILEGGGSCLNVSVNEWFSVLYLNDITLTDFSTPDATSLAGSFSLQGGISEIDGSNYTVTLVNAEDPSVVGTIDALIPHGGTTTFTVPQAGNYILSVTDDNGCTKEFVVRVPNVDPVELHLPDTTVAAEDTICVAITVKNWNDVFSFAYSLAWDASILQFINVQSIHPSIRDIFRDEDATATGVLPLVWIDFAVNGLSLPDDEILFELCFKAIGPPGSSSPVAFTSNPTDITITGETEDIPILLDPGTIEITIPDQVKLYVSACYNGVTSDGGLIIFGGEDPYTYEIRDDATRLTIVNISGVDGATFIPLSVATRRFTIVVTDDNGVEDRQSIDLADSPIAVDTTVVDPTCSNSGDGKIILHGITGGAANEPYRTTWTGPGLQRQNLDSLTDLNAGDYSIIVVDAYGCTDTTYIQLEDDTLMASFNSTPAVCEGRTGSITTDVIGSGSDFNFVWTDVGGSQLADTTVSRSHTLADVRPGKYFLTLSRGICSVQDSFTLGTLKSLAISLDSTSDVTCNGLTDGMLGISVGVDLNKAAPYTFAWSQPITDSILYDTATVLSQLGAGTYGVTVTDGSGCEVAGEFEVDEPSPIRMTPFVVQPSCPNGMDGRIEGLGINGGTPYQGRAEYDFSWYEIIGNTSTLLNVRNISGIVDLTAGTYGVAVLDANGCYDSTTVTLADGPTIRIILDQANVCPGDSAALLHVEGDLAGNTIAWSTGESTEIISDLRAGVYAVSVTETNMTGTCTAVDSIELVDPVINVTVNTPMQFDPQNQCHEPNLGFIYSLDIDVGGPKRYQWHSFNDTVTANPFVVIDEDGLYPFSVLNADGCVVYDSVIDARFPERIMVSLDTSQITCFGADDGSITVTASGRGGVFNFAWNDGRTWPIAVNTFPRPNLAPGIYQVTLTDPADSTCMSEIQVAINEPDSLQLVVDPTRTQNIRCFGQSNGQIGLDWIGGNRDAAPTITWTGGAAMNTLSAANLDAGDYTIVLTDSKGCQDSASVTITEPDRILARIPAPQEPACQGFQTVVTVDTASGGSGSAYTFSVDNGPSQLLTNQVPIFAGDHLITVFDGLGCKLDTTISVSEPAAISVDLGEDLELDLGDSIQLVPIVNSGAPAATFSWTPVELLSCMDCGDPVARPIDDQVFVVNVVDIDGCQATDEIMIRVDKSRKVFIPNGFSPNGDGFNDNFIVFGGTGAVRILSAGVFNRWGEMVSKYDGDAFPSDRSGLQIWDGVYAGEQADIGVYVYLVEIEFFDGRILTYRGDVTLVK